MSDNFTYSHINVQIGQNVELIFLNGTIFTFKNAKTIFELGHQSIA